MDIRTLQYFLAVANSRNISLAASALHLTQPTLSRQIIDLEKEIGKQLIIRHNRTITLTQEGMILKTRAEEIIALLDKTKKEITENDEMIKGEISVGTGETDGLRYIIDIMKTTNDNNPEIMFHIVSGDALDVCDRIDKGLLDFGVILGEFDHQKYNYITLPLYDTWGVLMLKDSVLAKKETIDNTDLWDKPLILSRQKTNKHSLYQWLDKEEGELNVVATYNLINNASLMVEEGMGYTFSLAKLVNTRDTNLCFKPLNPALTLGMALVWKKDRVFIKAAELFLNEVKKKIDNEPKKI